MRMIGYLLLSLALIVGAVPAGVSSTNIKILTAKEEVYLSKPKGMGIQSQLRDYYYHSKTGWAVLTAGLVSAGAGSWHSDFENEPRTVSLFGLDGAWKSDVKLDVRAFAIAYYGPKGLIVAEKSGDSTMWLYRIVDGKVLAKREIALSGTMSSQLSSPLARFPGEVFCDRLIVIRLSDGGWLLDLNLNVLASPKEFELKWIYAAACEDDSEGLFYIRDQILHQMTYSYFSGRVTQVPLDGMNLNDLQGESRKVGPWPTGDGAALLVPIGYPKITGWKLRLARVGPPARIEIFILDADLKLPPEAIPQHLEGEANYNSIVVGGGEFPGKLPGYSVRKWAREEKQSTHEMTPEKRESRTLFYSGVYHVFSESHEVCKSDTTWVSIRCWNWESNKTREMISSPAILWQDLNAGFTRAKLLSDNRMITFFTRFVSLPGFQYGGDFRDAGKLAPDFEGLYCDGNYEILTGAGNDGFVSCYEPEVWSPTHIPKKIYYVNFRTKGKYRFDTYYQFPKGRPAIRDGKLLTIYDRENRAGGEVLELSDLQTGDSKEFELPPAWRGKTSYVRQILPTKQGWWVIYCLWKEGYSVWRLAPDARPLGPPIAVGRGRKDPTYCANYTTVTELNDGRILLAAYWNDYDFMFLGRDGGDVAFARIEADQAREYLDGGLVIRTNGEVYLLEPTQIVKVRFE